MMLFRLLFVLSFCTAFAQTPPSEKTVTLTNIPYYSELALAGADDYQRAQCRLDLRYPADRKGFATVVWFHGGGLEHGHRHLVDLKDPSIAVAAVGYRLSPKVPHPGYLEDAGAATAWVLANIAQYGGDSNKVFVSGHSAGGYLSAMVGMDARWLSPHGFSNLQLAGIIPISGQMATHYLVRQLMGDNGPRARPLINEFAPIYHSSSNLPPICLIAGDRTLEMANRTEENALLAASLRSLGHPCVEFYEMGGLDHGAVGEGGLIPLRKFIRRCCAPKKQ
ncbi:MAG TPA: alpha/beta hydrolase [Kiritimatiellia bacterium]|nr:alpha/beta hydrolase [Kiritimatiellia bacterium]HRU70061.1 alpha/beta hydrolase [Kiritimatiellia bacterium]